MLQDLRCHAGRGVNLPVSELCTWLTSRRLLPTGRDDSTIIRALSGYPPIARLILRKWTYMPFRMGATMDMNGPVSLKVKPSALQRV